MRSVIAVLACLAILTSVAVPAIAGECDPTQREVITRVGGITCVAQLPDEANAPPPAPPAPPQEVPVGVWRSWPVMATLPDGTRCTSRDGAMLDPSDTGWILNSAGYWDLHDFLARGGQEPQPCPWMASTARPPLTAAVQDQVALPTPQTNPSRGLVGKDTYLITNGSTTFGRRTLSATVAGFAVAWEVEADGVFHVDWGDGTVTGPHASTGGPWPEGDITHTYTRHGRYTIAVTEQWTVRYRRLSPAPQQAWSTFTMTTGPYTIPGFDVVELQPVRES